MNLQIKDIVILVKNYLNDNYVYIVCQRVSYFILLEIHYFFILYIKLMFCLYIGPNHAKFWLHTFRAKL